MATHALTGCDTVCYLYGKGKAIAIYTMMKTEICLEIYLQTMLWKAAVQVNPSEIIGSVNISDFGWNIVRGVPHPCTGGTEVVPPELLEMVACGCSATSACSREQCSCQALFSVDV